MISSILAYGIIPPFFLSTFPTWAMSLGFGLLVFGTLFRFFHDWLFYWPADHDNEIKIKPIRASAFQHDYFETPEMVAKKDKKKAMYDTIVIGTGSGGCACANLLAQSGQKVLVLEQHEERTGGCTHTFRDNGCEWDTGLHYTSRAMASKDCRPGAIMNFMTKGLQEWSFLDDPYDEIVFPKNDTLPPEDQGFPNSSSYAFVRGMRPTVNSILKDIDPHNVTNMHLKQRATTYMELCNDINQGFTALGLSKILPAWMTRLFVQKRIDRLIKFASMTVRDVQYAIFNCGYSIEDLFNKGCPAAPSEEAGDPDPPAIRRLKGVLTHPIGDYAVQPREATMAAHGVTMAHYMDGAAYTKGPTQNISIRSTSMVREFGGEVFVDATVQEILVEEGPFGSKKAVGVRVCKTSELAAANAAHLVTHAMDTNGAAEEAELGTSPTIATTEIYAKNVVCATGVYNLYNKLLPQHLPEVQDFQNPTKRTIRQSNGHIFLFCKIEGDATALKLPTHNIWYFNSYNVDKAFDTYFANPRTTRPPTVYIGFPCTKDTTWKKRYPNVSNCVLISDGLWEWFAEWQHLPVHERGPAYEEFKAQLSKHLLDILYESVPQVKDKVVYSFLGTPLSEVTYLSSYHGGSYGTMCLPSMFDTNINCNIWTITPKTKISNLFMAGSDAFLPAVCGAMYGGVFGACAVLGHVGTVRMMVAFLLHFTKVIQDENPKMTWYQALTLAVDKLVNE